jgi:glycosyltransferase involved in cell wall biosynthesis
LIRWISVSYNILKLVTNDVFKGVFSDRNEVTCYFFWGRESAEVVPLIPSKIKVICKFYNYDLYQNVWGYLAYQSSQMKRANYIVACSEDNKKYMINNYPKFKDKILIDYLGTEIPSSGSQESKDGVLRLVSCSFMMPHKRLEIIAECLSYVDFPLQWIHIGDGPLRSDLEKKTEIICSAKTNIKVTFLGVIPTHKLIDYYVSNPVDLFINTSSTEGIPISMMEVMSLKIPVIAADVGGVKELIVDGVNGYLMNKNIDPKNLAKQIAIYADLDYDSKKRFRESARKIIETKFECYRCARGLADEIFN